MTVSALPYLVSNACHDECVLTPSPEGLETIFGQGKLWVVMQETSFRRPNLPAFEQRNLCFLVVSQGQRWNRFDDALIDLDC